MPRLVNNIKENRLTAKKIRRNDIFKYLGKYLDKVDRVMTQVDRITEDIDHMPVAAFIFRDQESDEVHYSANIRLPYS